jgi:hypothetical protein
LLCIESVTHYVLDVEVEVVVVVLLVGLSIVEGVVVGF